MNRPLLNISTETLWAEFRNLLAVTADNFKRMAIIWCELKERGEDMSAYVNPLTARLPAVAAGRLLPEILIRYAAKPELLDALESLVPEGQAKLATDTARVPVLIWKDGKQVVANRRPAELTAAEVRQVFAFGVIRDRAQQRHHLPPEPPKGRGGRYLGAVDVAVMCDALGLTPAQRDDLVRAASALNLDPPGVIRRLLVTHLIIRDDTSAAAT